MVFTNPGTIIVQHSDGNVTEWRLRAYRFNDLVANVLVPRGSDVGGGNYHVSLASLRAAINAPNQGVELQLNVAAVNPAGESEPLGAADTAIFWNTPVAPGNVQIAQ